ncbi:MAG: ATP-binding protein [Myxococcota bacterium]
MPLRWHRKRITISLMIDFHAALRHAGALQRVVTLRELVEATQRAVVDQTRYRHAWLALFESEGATHARLVEFAGAREVSELAFATCPLMPIAGDAMMEAIVSGRAPVVVDDARTDPRTNKDFVARIGNRTIINVPLVLGNELWGALGVGTFGDEGVMPPTSTELEALTVLGMQLAAAYARWQLLERQRESERARQDLERHLEALQRVELMGVLASGVAHDLNNYLTVIQSGVDLVTSNEPGLIEDLQLATARAREVTRQLLTLGRAQAPRREPIQLGAHVESTVQLVRSSIPRGVRVIVERTAAPPVEGDPVQIDQVLANLLINARDAVGERGTIHVGVDEQVLGSDFAQTHAWARPGRYGRVWVRDDGCGIPPENLQRIFDPLFSTKTRGTGLGLAVVSRVVQQHAGLVHCDSAPGRGTTFDVYLPALAPS